MSKSDPSAVKKERKKSIRWVVTIFLVTIFVSGLITFVSDIIMEASTMLVAFLILLVIVLLGIVFDIIGMAVATADEKPFHSMDARKVPGAQEAIRLLRKAERVSSICNDVIGDICGIVSGAAATTIAVSIADSLNVGLLFVNLTIAAIVASLTIGGKAMGKSFAINKSDIILYEFAKFVSNFYH